MHFPTVRTRTAGVLASSALAVVLATVFWLPSGASTPPRTPGTFNGMGFDSCGTPSKTTMDRWRRAKENPYHAIGVYISGSERACSQPNLTRSWVSHVTSTGWHVLPITVGPQAQCSGFRIRVNGNPKSIYRAARIQGANQAKYAVAAAQRLGIWKHSTLYYDMESWHTGYTRCDASTLWFLSAWSNTLHNKGYLSGVYSSASSGARELDKMATHRPRGYVLPDNLWFAQWNDKENVASSYISPKHWANRQRVHQFWGGHRATNGGVSLNIDSNWINVAMRPIPRHAPPPTSPNARVTSLTSAISAPQRPAKKPTTTAKPSAKPTATASAKPTTKPTATSSAKSTATASAKPSASPTAKSTATSSATPTASPSGSATASTSPSRQNASKHVRKPSGATTSATPTPSAKPSTTSTAKPHKATNKHAAKHAAKAKEQQAKKDTKKATKHARSTTHGFRDGSSDQPLPVSSGSGSDPQSPVLTAASGIQPPVHQPAPPRPAALQDRTPDMGNQPAPVAAPQAPVKKVPAQQPKHGSQPLLSPMVADQMRMAFANMNDSLQRIYFQLFAWRI